MLLYVCMYVIKCKIILFKSNWAVQGLWLHLYELNYWSNAIHLLLYPSIGKLKQKIWALYRNITPASFDCNMYVCLYVCIWRIYVFTLSLGWSLEVYQYFDWFGMGNWKEIQKINVTYTYTYLCLCLCLCYVCYIHNNNTNTNAHDKYT